MGSPGVRIAGKGSPLQRSRWAELAATAVLDCGGVLLFVIIGRHAHHNGISLAGIWHTAWPFLAGLAIGLTATRAWRRPLALAPTGLGAWLGAAAAGMVIRVLAGQGTAAAFIAVTLVFLCLVLLGWRLVAVVAAGRRPRHFRRTGMPGSQQG